MLRQGIEAARRVRETVRGIHARTLCWRKGVRAGPGTTISHGVEIDHRGGVIVFGRQVRLGSHVHLGVDYGARLAIGDGVVVGHGTRLTVASGDLTIGANADIAENVHLSVRAHPGSRIAIGAHVYLGPGVQLSAAGAPITIGEDGMLGPHCCLMNFDHRSERTDVPMRLQGEAQGLPIILEHDVWLGALVTVTKGVIIGHGAIVGANAVVTKDIPAHGLALGIPAKVVRVRTASQEESGATPVR